MSGQESDASESPAEERGDGQPTTTERAKSAERRVQALVRGQWLAEDVAKFKARFDDVATDVDVVTNIIGEEGVEVIKDLLGISEVVAEIAAHAPWVGPVAMVRAVSESLEQIAPLACRVLFDGAAKRGHWPHSTHKTPYSLACVPTCADITRYCNLPLPGPASLR